MAWLCTECMNNMTVAMADLEKVGEYDGRSKENCYSRQLW